MLAVLHVLLSPRDGGAERQDAALLAGLARAGHRVLGVVRRGTPIEQRAIEDGAPIFPLGPSFPLGPGGILTWWSRGRARLLAAGGGWDLIHFSDPDSYARTAGLIARGAGGRLPPSRQIVSCRGHGGALSRSAAGALRRHQRAGGMIVTASESLRAVLVSEGLDEERLAVVHPGIDVKRFVADAAARAAVRCELGFDDRSEVVGTVAVLDRDRGIETFLDAAAMVDETEALYDRVLKIARDA